MTELVDQDRTGVFSEHQGAEFLGAVLQPCRLTIPARKALEAAGATITPVESPVIFSAQDQWARDPAQHWRVALGKRCPGGLIANNMLGSSALCIRTTEEPPWPSEAQPASMWPQLDLTPCPKCGHALVAVYVPGYRVCAGPDHHHWQAARLGKEWSAPPRPPLLPPPTPEELRALRRERGWSAAEAAAAFGMASGRRWREVEAGPSRMDPARWTLGMLSLGLHPTLTLVPRAENPQIAPGSPIAAPPA